MVGGFTVTILDDKGAVVASYERTTRGGRPSVGEEILLDGTLYRVERVVHEDERDDRTVRRYVEPRVYVRRSRGRAGRHGAIKVLPLGTSRSPGRPK